MARAWIAVDLKVYPGMAIPQGCRTVQPWLQAVIFVDFPRFGLSTCQALHTDTCGSLIDKPGCQQDLVSFPNILSEQGTTYTTKVKEINLQTI